jgi:2-polyprenyl-3-methyl-5-hydroxy-6-metoxy-1,4-benzoquinol methylase
MPASPPDDVRQYFDQAAQRFDLIYREDKGPLQRLVDHLFRGVIHRRFQITLERCGDVSGQRVLDVGCGSGRYSVEFARRGANVLGLDISATMIEMADAAAAASGVSDRCRFEQAEFLSWTDPEPFDIGLAMGFFDYVTPASTFVQRLGEHVHGRVFCSFPVRWTLRSLPRWARLRLSGCPVHFYGGAQVTALFADAPWRAVGVDRLSRDFLVDAHSA